MVRYMVDSNLVGDLLKNKYPKYIGCHKYINYEVFMEVLGVRGKEDLESKFNRIKKFPNKINNIPLYILGRSFLHQKCPPNRVRNDIKRFLKIVPNMNIDKFIEIYNKEKEMFLEKQEHLVGIFKDAYEKFKNEKIAIKEFPDNSQQRIENYFYDAFNLKNIHPDKTIGDFREFLFVWAKLNMEKIMNIDCKQLNFDASNWKNMLTDISMLYCCAFDYKVLTGDKKYPVFDLIYNNPQSNFRCEIIER